MGIKTVEFYSVIPDGDSRFGMHIGTHWILFRIGREDMTCGILLDNSG